MAEITVNRICQLGFLTYLLLFTYVSTTTAVSLDLTELRNKVAKIKVNPRGNLWATGHFMGKKSVLDSPLLAAPGDSAALDPERSAQDVRELITQEVLKVALQAQLQDSTARQELNDQETGLLMKILGSYIQKSRK
ncbi:neuromedin Ba [Amia ocellicauda]|uniref:neuromedin Ba n=1 Tax=Amia ocellicauda TaxID=2972642 RepID=UPI003464A20F